MNHIHLTHGIVHGAVAVAVVAHGAVKHVVFQHAIHGLALGHVGAARLTFHAHAGANLCRTGSHERTIHFHHAGVARLDGAELLMVAKLGDAAVLTIRLLHGGVRRHVRMLLRRRAARSGQLRILHGGRALAWRKVSIVELIAGIRHADIGLLCGPVQHLNQQFAFSRVNDTAIDQDFGGERAVERRVQQTGF